VCLSRGPGSEKGRRQVEEIGQAVGDRLLRRKAGNPGHRNDGAGFAARAWHLRDLRAGLRVQAPWHAQPVGRDRSAHREGPHALVKERHRSREFIEFLKLLDAAYPASTAIKLILDNHSAHISRETRAWLDARPPGRFEFTFTPKHGSWLNLIEGFFSKFARSVLRHIRVASKHELKERIMAGIDDVNRYPVIHTWSYKLAEAA
jgi:transposase